MPDRAPDARSLRPLRLRAMLTQEELALKAGVGTRTVRDIESGRVRPQPKTLRLIVEALGLGEEDRALLAGTPRAGAPAPRELPRSLAAFAGRERHLGDLLAAVDAGAAVVAVHGMAGVGKTALAVRAAHALAPRYPDGQLFVDLQGFTRAAGHRPSRESVLARVLRVLGADEQDLPAGAGELAAAYRSALAGRRVLLLLDNAAGAEEVEALLPGTADVLTLATSRRDLSAVADAVPVPLGPPPMREAVAMFEAAAGDRVTAAEAAAVAERCGRLPLAMGLAAARLRSRPLWSVEDLLRRLDDEERLLDELDMGHRGVAAALRASYRELDADQRRLLRRLGLVPGEDVDARAAAALCGTGPEEASAALESLVDVHLVETHAPGRYRLHDLVRVFAAGRADAEETGAGRDAAFRRLLGGYLHFAFQAAVRVPSQYQRMLAKEAAAHDLGLPGFDGQAEAIAWFQAERGNLAAAVHAAERAGLLEPAWHLANAFSAFRMHGRDARRHLEVNGMALGIARRLGDERKTAHSLGDRGRHLMFAGRNREAAGCLEEVAALRRGLGDAGGAALALRSIGILHRQSGRFAEALEVYRSAFALAESASDTRTMVNIAVNAVDPLLSLGRLAEAERSAAEAERHLGADDDYNPVRIEVCRGTFARMHGDPAAALAVHTACLERCRRAGLLGGFTPTLIELGEDLLALGRTGEAVARLGQAVEQAEEMAYLSFERTARNALGRALAASGDLAGAVDQHERVLRLAESQEDAYQLAEAHHGLAEARRAEGDAAAAQRHLRSAAAGYERCGVPGSGLLPRVR
ncbi:tetratricopeptide repeat protein [Glycomyces sp. A-F 0318]|uniref:ATP-binding protein n=1 Tax=Glycomyces amatae TaxID=2881355 RepID=UPI001E3E7673|nr:tetratricopeptide repeat protein [Glycomyces amatae]MCD0443045.1 tetratricopeptide repeat protein [Glycomyces amatae]